ncbi:MAG: dual specificity protein phosphatase family protein [Ruegeria sp.]
MKPSMYPVSAEYPGQLFIMPKPSGEWLEDDVRHYHSMGVDVVISMLEDTEATELSLQDEGRVCLSNNMEFLNFPIPDRGLPDKKNFTELVALVRSRLSQNKSVAIHCRAGIGRSGMLVCCALSKFVGSPSAAIQLVSCARGVEVPDTAEQREFIESIAMEIDG